MTHALITGGAGFIGSHLAEHLLAAGYAVTVVDDLSTGQFKNIAPFETPCAVSITRLKTSATAW